MMTAAEKQKAYRDRKRAGAMEAALPWPLNKNKPPRWGEGVAVYVPPTVEEQEAMLKLEDGMVHEKEFFKRNCALPQCGKPFETDLLLMRFCCREHQVERLRQLDTRSC